MAEAVLEIALENLSSLIQNELRFFLGADEEMIRLSRTLTTIQAVLEDAEEKQLTNRTIKIWLQRLKDAAYVLDDILDEYSTEALQLEHQAMMCGSAKKVQSPCLSVIHPKHVLFCHKIARKMKRIRKTLDEIAEERSKFHLCETVVVERKAEVMELRQTTSIIKELQVYGREEEKEKIVDFLVFHATHFDPVLVYPIVGMGGLGKTTLAQLIFNNERVVNHFELRIWVCVSEDFSLNKMLKAIIESASGRACQDLHLESLQRRLQELVERKRYLLVLDDVWNDDQEKWDRLKYVLACGSKGASILVTTRLAKVASIMGTTSSYQLPILSEDDCWELFKHRAFGLDKGEREELVAIGKEIVKKCKGVPLAAKALGGLLRFKSEERDWFHVKESKLWSLPQNEISILPALRLSYLNLPVKLRQCFAFCAIFPKDQEISKRFLIELWMANSFFSSNEKMDLEDVGDEVWNELYWRSFFHDIKIDESGNISFKMHDLVHDLAQSITEEACCITNDNTPTRLIERTRHLSIYGNKLSNRSDLLQSSQIKSLRTFVRPASYYHNPELLKCCSLRVLDFYCPGKLPSSISQLKHLRYLNLSHGSFEMLPEFICSLRNLQILKLENCASLQNLPNNFTCLRTLRHLYLKGCSSLSSLPPKMGQLTLLNTLDVYIVGKKRGFLLAELGCLNIKGELHIQHLERVTSVTDAREANMANKHLNELQLSWDKNAESTLQENVEQILQILEPQEQNLRSLRIEGYKGFHFPQWMGSATLKHLLSVELVDCVNCVQLPSLGKLPYLENLRIMNMNHVRFLDDESCLRGGGGVVEGFKALKLMILIKLPNLEMLSNEEYEDNMIFPCLSKLVVDGSPRLWALPCLPSLKELHLSGKCSQALLSSMQNLHNLESLWLNYDNELTSFPEGMLCDLTSLKLLSIVGYNNLEVLPAELSHLNTLEQLSISDCNSLEEIPVQVLQGLHRSLRKLDIRQCCRFNVSAGFQNLTSLQDLHLASCLEVEALPEALQHLTSLQSLSLWDLPNLASLPRWFGSIKNLQSLYITKCPRLMSLPASIQCLSNLKTLTIRSCTELKKRCEKEIGEDWHKIAHVLHVDM